MARITESRNDKRGKKEYVEVRSSSRYFINTYRAGSSNDQTPTRLHCNPFIVVRSLSGCGGSCSQTRHGLFEQFNALPTFGRREAPEQRLRAESGPVFHVRHLCQQLMRRQTAKRTVWRIIFGSVWPLNEEFELPPGTGRVLA
jgi:hypothetical protein